MHHRGLADNGVTGLLEPHPRPGPKRPVIIDDQHTRGHPRILSPRSAAVIGASPGHELRASPEKLSGLARRTSQG